MEDSDRGAVLWIDVYGLVFQSYHALKNMATKRGFPTGVIIGTLSSSLKAKLQFHPQQIFVCWDCPRIGNWRTRKKPDYKQPRGEKDPRMKWALSEQIPLLRRLIKNLGYTQLYNPNLEADDLMALGVSFVSETRPGVRQVLLTSDKDLYQLLEYPGVSIVNPHSNKSNSRRPLGRAEVESQFGINVERWAEYLALGGDSSDNITVPGMGPKTAIKLIQKGVDLRKPLERQPTPLKEYLTPRWSALQLAYELAHLPRSPRDERIRQFTPGMDMSKVLASPSLKSAHVRRRNIAKILSQCQATRLLSQVSKLGLW